MRNRDPRGYYRALNISADASPEEIILSYRLLKQAFRERHGKMDIARIQAAYDTLSDPKLRADYDGRGGAARRGQPRASGGALGTPAILMVLLGVLAIVLIWTLGPSLRVALTSFDTGDQLVLRDGGAVFGTVAGYEPDHVFHNGARAPAYLVQKGPEEIQQWYPAGDLARLTRAR